MRKRLQRSILCAVWGAAMLNLSCQGGAIANSAAPTLCDVIKLEPGMEITNEEVIYKVLSKGHTNGIDYLECIASFDNPVTYDEGIDRMVFPRLVSEPFYTNAEEDGVVSFTTFIVKMSCKSGSLWRTRNITAYKLGDTPSVASYSARR